MRSTIARCIVSACLCACTPTSEPPAPSESPRTSPKPPAVVVEPIPTTEPAAPGGCAEVGIGLDLRALPTGSDQQDIQWYTRGQASDFEALAPADVRVELFVASGGIATFDARIFASSGPEALRHCRAMTEAFIPGVPAHPRSDESGGSVTSPCEPCAVDGRDQASPDPTRADP